MSLEETIKHADEHRQLVAGFVVSAVTISSDDIMLLDPEKKHE